MTTRKTVLIDRLVTLLVAVLLLAVAAAAGWWWSGRSGWAERVDTSPVATAVGSGWWPWASGVAGIVLILVGLRWIAAHLNRQRVSTLHLRGSGAAGRLDVTGSKLAGAAADALGDTLGVRSARGAVVRDRGQLVARLVATIEPEADLGSVARHADVVSAQLAQALERDDLRCSVELRVATFARSLPRAS